MEIINFIKRKAKSIKDFFEKPTDMTNTEMSFTLVIFLLMVILSIVIFLPFGIVYKISLVYCLSCLWALLTTVNIDTDLAYDVCFYYSLPYILLMMLSIKITSKFIPYRGNDPMLIRSGKIKYLKRKVKINRLKFWK